MRITIVYTHLYMYYANTYSIVFAMLSNFFLFPFPLFDNAYYTK